MSDFSPPYSDRTAERTATATPTALEPEAIRARVLVYSSQKLIAKYSIENGEYIIGRDATCHILVDADEVSRHHARLTLSGFELILEDIGSSNGVFIDGVQVQIPTRVRQDQEIQIGRARLRIGLEESASRQLVEALWDKDLGLEAVRQMLEDKKYRVITSIARGGMGVIMQARDLRIRRTVAMKVMKTGTQFSRENVVRFIDEAQTTGQLEHPNIVPVYELGLDEEGETYYTMKYVKGVNLADVLRGLRRANARMTAKYPLANLITIFQKICDGMAFAHSKGVVHRDLKPENVMVGAYGEVLVMDWGLAKNMTSARREPGQASSPQPTGIAPEVAALDGRGFETMHGLVVGTPPYISPEQARGELDKIDARSDVFVLGEILYSILTLRAPVSGETVAELVEKILSSNIAPPSSFNLPIRNPRRTDAHPGHETVALVHCPNRRVPEGLSAVVMKAMQLDPAHRYQSVEEMQADITAWQGGFATKAERASVLKHTLLFVGRHKASMTLATLGFVLFNLMVAGFIYQLQQETRRAQLSEKEARTNALLADERLRELHGTAPTYYAEAQNLVDDQEFARALDKIDYAIEQVPNDPDYLTLRGHVLQSLLRWDEALAAYETALTRNPNHKAALQNLALTKRLLGEVQRDGKMTPDILRHFHAGLLVQNRMSAALAALRDIGQDRDLYATTWKMYFLKRGWKDRALTNDDETIQVDLSRLPNVDLRKLGDAPIVKLILDDTGLTDLTPLNGREIQELSLNRTKVQDIRPLTGMPLKIFSADSTPLDDIAPLARSPLEWLRISNTAVAQLGALKGMKKLQDLNAANCRRLKELAPLRGLPLIKLDVSRTAISNLEPLVGCPLHELNLEGCVDLVDLKPLLQIKTLEVLILPIHCKDIDFLRAHPSLKRLSYKKTSQPVYEFWEEFDARKAAAPPAPAPPASAK